MDEEVVSTPNDVVERNIAFVSEITRYLLSNPQVFSSLPDGFELVVLPDDDPEMRLYNLELLDRYGSEGRPIVFARIKGSQGMGPDQIAPTFFVPVQRAA